MPPTMAPALGDWAGTVEGSGLIIVNSIMGGSAVGLLLPTELAYDSKFGSVATVVAKVFLSIINKLLALIIL